MNHQPVEYIRQTRETYDRLGYPPYRWFHADEPPSFAPLAKPVRESRLGLISSAGTYMVGQIAYYYKDDTSIRRIPRDVSLDDLRFSHITENYLVEARQDPATVFPSEALAKLAREGVIGELADNYFSCMGGIYSQNRVRSELIPNLEVAVADERLDILLLVPL